MLTRRTFFRRALGAAVGVLAAVYVPRLVFAKPLVGPLDDKFVQFMREVQAAARADPPIPFGEITCGPDGGYLIPPHIAKAVKQWEMDGFPPIHLDPPRPGLTATWTKDT